jgi:hypothetical protein
MFLGLYASSFLNMKDDIFPRTVSRSGENRNKETTVNLGEEIHQVLRCSNKTWYGLPVDITVSSSNLHRVSVLGLAFPHPGLVNMVSRLGLPIETRLALTAQHELGHLQTLPIPLVHLLILLWPRKGRPVGPRWRRFLVFLLTQQAVWEIAAESYVAVTDHQNIQSKRYKLARYLYAGFWGGMTILAFLGTRFLLQRDGWDPG